MIRKAYTAVLWTVFTVLLLMVVGLIVDPARADAPIMQNWAPSGGTELPEFRWEPTPNSREQFGFIHYTNQETRGNTIKTSVVPTSRGDIEILHKTTDNSKCPYPGCPDHLEIITVPPGMIAIPWNFTTEEGAYQKIVIKEWLGV